MIRLSGLVLGVLICTGCQNYERSSDSMTSGNLRIGIDESYSLMMSSQIAVFEKMYSGAHLFASYKPEAEIIEDLLNDSIESAIISRALTEDEMAFFRTRKKIPESVKIAVDGLALIVNPANPDTVLSLREVEDFFKGGITNWGQIRNGASDEPIQIVFDHNKSCNARYIRERFLQGGNFPENCFAVHSNEEVIDHVSTHPNSLGVISVSWISDREDSTSQAFLEKVSVVAIADSTNQRRPEMARKPYQAYIYDESYPLRRDVYAIRAGTRGSVGTGFVSFLYGEKGQLIIHKMGMVAAQSPVRVIRITE
jgi:phosphate transport system substrate-binding protein